MSGTSRIQPLLSQDNPNVKRWKKIASNPRSVKKLSRTLAEGAHLAAAALEALKRRRLSKTKEGNALPFEVTSVILREDSASEEARSLFNRFLEEDLPIRFYTAPFALYEAFTPVENGVGITLEIEIPSVKKPEKPLDVDALYLDGVQDAGNVGTILRTALAAGIHHLAFSPKTALLWSPKVLRAAMGAHFALNLYEDVVAEEIPKLFSGEILAADARGGRNLFTESSWEKHPTVWMFGAEGPGLSERALSEASARYLIPIESECESLNVAAAAAVILFEQKRRRLLGCV